jgi:hypothetical protein
VKRSLLVLAVFFALTVPAATAASPPGATALCRDGTYSFSKHRSETCSGHGGVKRWLTEAKVVVINQEARHTGDFVSSLADWAGILTFILLLVGGLVGFLTRINNGLHVSSFLLETDTSLEAASGQILVAPGVQFTNTRPTIALRLQAERFDARINGIDAPPFPVNDAPPQYLAPGQDDRTTSRSPMWIPASSGLQVLMWWEFSYGRQSRAMWWMRRSVSGSTVLLANLSGSMTSKDWEGPPRDRWLVPFTARWRKAGWRTGKSEWQTAPEPNQTSVTTGTTMRVGELLSTQSNKRIDDSWISADCEACGTSNNLGDAPTETRGDTFVYLCSKCGADVIDVRHTGGGNYETDVGKPGFAIQVPHDDGPG